MTTIGEDVRTAQPPVPPADLAGLFTPFACGALRLPNRFVMSPMTRNFSPGGVPGADVAAYYARRAAAGMGLIVTEGIGVDHPAAVGHGTMGEHDIPVLHGDAATAGWRAVVDAVHAAGGRIAPQLWHMGPIRLDGSPPRPDAASMRPSGVWGPLNRAALPPAYLQQVARPTASPGDAEIADVIDAFARSAAAAVRIGFDAIALHGAHGYLIDSFLWAETNRRSDRWGGDARGRTRFAVEVIRAVRAAMPAAMPLMLRFSQWKLQDYDASLAATPRELEAVLTPLANAGVDIFDASTRRFDAPAFPDSPLGLAGWTRRITGRPVMTVGGIGFDKDLQSSFVEPTRPLNNLEEVARRFENGEFDLAAVGRAALMDPDWIGKARRGEAFAPFDLAAYGALN